MTVLGDGTFGRSVVHEGRAYKIGISALINETPESSLTPSTGRYSEKAVSKQKVGFHQALNMLIP